MKTTMIFLFTLFASLNIKAATPISHDILKDCKKVNTTFDEAYEVRLYDCTKALKSEEKTMVQATFFKRFNHKACWFKGSELNYPDSCYSKQIIAKKI